MALVALAILPALASAHGRLRSNYLLPKRRDVFFRVMRKTLGGRRRPLLFCLPIFRAEQGNEGGEDEEQQQQQGQEQDYSSFSVLTSIRSQYNEIVVVDTPKSRVLLLDSTHNVHSILNKGQMLTGSYWDEFATLPAIIPRGPIAILGLGGGTAAHLMLDLWPSLHLDGWEIDEILIDKAREYFGLSDLEKCTHASGFLSVNVGDALSPHVTIPGGYAGIVVDLFSDGKILPQLQEFETWLDLGKKLMPNGRIMVNCGGAHAETSKSDDGMGNPISSNGKLWIQNSTIKALSKAFHGELSWKRMAEKDSENYLALTGPMPDLDSWSATVPKELSSNVKQWKHCERALDNYLEENLNPSEKSLKIGCTPH